MNERTNKMYYRKIQGALIIRGGLKIYRLAKKLRRLK